jgi:hypothetical protein
VWLSGRTCVVAFANYAPARPPGTGTCAAGTAHYALRTGRSAPCWAEGRESRPARPGPRPAEARRCSRAAFLCSCCWRPHGRASASGIGHRAAPVDPGSRKAGRCSQRLATGVVLALLDWPLAPPRVGVWQCRGRKGLLHSRSTSNRSDMVEFRSIHTFFRYMYIPMYY